MAKQISAEGYWKLLLSGLSIFVPMASALLTYLVLSVHSLEIKINDLAARTTSIRDHYNLDRSISVLKERSAGETREIVAIKELQAEHDRRIQQLEKRK